LRKLLSILLLAILALPMASPLLALGLQDDAGLPSCCRRNGAHHCSGMNAEASVASAQRPSVIAAPQQCPRYLAALVAIHPTPFIPVFSTSVFAEMASKPKIETRSFFAGPNTLDSAHPKRGPPITL